MKAIFGGTSETPQTFNLEFSESVQALLNTVVSGSFYSAALSLTTTPTTIELDYDFYVCGFDIPTILWNVTPTPLLTTEEITKYDGTTADETFYNFIAEDGPLNPVFTLVTTFAEKGNPTLCDTPDFTFSGGNFYMPNYYQNDCNKVLQENCSFTFLRDSLVASGATQFEDRTLRLKIQRVTGTRDIEYLGYVFDTDRTYQTFYINYIVCTKPTGNTNLVFRDIPITDYADTIPSLEEYSKIKWSFQVDSTPSSRTKFKIQEVDQEVLCGTINWKFEAYYDDGTDVTSYVVLD